jgi:hypothetical protein
MKALIIDKEAVEKVRVYAQEHPYSVADLMRVMKGVNPPAGDNPRHVCHLFFGYRVVYSIEDQPHLGLCHHLSVSADTKDKAPSVEAVEALMKEFGISGTVYDCLHVWIENRNQFITKI